MILKNISNQIIFVDEDFPYMTSHEFATAMFNSDNYFVLITREEVENLLEDDYAVVEFQNKRMEGYQCNTLIRKEH